MKSKPPVCRAPGLLWILLPNLLCPEYAHAELTLSGDPIAEVVASAKEATPIPLSTYFQDLEERGTVVKFHTNAPEVTDFYIELFDAAGSADVLTPATVANFLAYVSAGRYDQTIIHRSVRGFVLQGGGFTAPDEPFGEVGGLPAEVAAYPAVVNEPGNSNVRGTMAMAKLGGDPNSATSEWFFNLADNSANLDAQNGGFTVFARVLGDGMNVVDEMAQALLLYGDYYPSSDRQLADSYYDWTDYFFDEYTEYRPFDDLPFWRWDNDPLEPQDFLRIEAVSVTEDLPLSYAVTTFTGNALDSAEVVGDVLVLTPSASATPRARSTVTVSAVSAFDGSSVEQAFDVILDSRLGLPSGVLNLLLDDDLPSPGTVE